MGNDRFSEEINRIPLDIEKLNKYFMENYTNLNQSTNLQDLGQFFVQINNAPMWKRTSDGYVSPLAETPERNNLFHDYVKRIDTNDKIIPRRIYDTIIDTYVNIRDGKYSIARDGLRFLEKIKDSRDLDGETRRIVKRSIGDLGEMFHYKI